MTVTKLIHKSSTEIYDLARKRDLKGRGSMNTAGRIIALAEEDLSEEAEAIVRASSKDLQAKARKAEMEGYSKLSKSELQERLLTDSLGVEDTGAPAASASSSSTSSSHTASSNSDKSGDTHFDGPEQRAYAIHDAAHQALDEALKEKRSYVVVESYRKKDSGEPLSIQPSYMQRHENTEVVVEIMIPHHQHRRS